MKIVLILLKFMNSQFLIREEALKWMKIKREN